MSLHFSPFASETLLLQGAHLSQIYGRLFLVFFSSNFIEITSKKKRKRDNKPYKSEDYKTASGKLRLL